jgi:hypothetical protein
MMLRIGYFAEPAAPDVHPAKLMVAKGHFATREEAVAHARANAERLHAHSFIIDFPDGKAERQLRQGKAWKIADFESPAKPRSLNLSR